ncbi:MAG: AarF/ABC1/UbiB kinase family protein [Candidatus Sumerlaeota bacterium]
MDITQLGTIQRTYRHANRYRQILAVLIRYGFHEFVQALHIDKYVDLGEALTAGGVEVSTLNRWERLRNVIEELGPTFIKIGQVLSTRPDKLPLELVNELQKLQDAVPPFPFSEVRAIIELEFGRPIAEVFAQFEEPPLAAASIGQVHRAILNTGEVVVVKVRRPAVEQTMAVDLEILYHIAMLAERHVDVLEVQKPAEVVKELQQTLHEEIDYTREAAHMERFSRNFEDDPNIRAPIVYRELCTERILIQEYIEGIKVADLDLLREKGYDLPLIANRGAHAMLRQIFVHGFFHADPHPGNIFILAGNVICFIDFGMMGRLPKRARGNLIDLLTAIVSDDDAGATDALLALTIWTDEPDRNDLEAHVAEFIQTHCVGPLKNIQLGRVLQEMMQQAQRHKLRIPPNLYLVIKALSTVEGIGRVLDPEFDVFSEATPVVRKIQQQRLEPKIVAKGALRSVRQLGNVIKSLPHELRSLLHQLKVGKLHIEFEHKGLEKLEHTLDRITNRVSFSLVLAALLISSSVIIRSGMPPRYHDVSIIGLLGYLLSALMGFRLLISIWRSGRL